jgi:hypothetical protein
MEAGSLIFCFNKQKFSNASYPATHPVHTRVAKLDFSNSLFVECGCSMLIRSYTKPMIKNGIEKNVIDFLRVSFSEPYSKFAIKMFLIGIVCNLIGFFIGSLLVS